MSYFEIRKKLRSLKESVDSTVRDVLTFAKPEVSVCVHVPDSGLTPSESESCIHCGVPSNGFFPHSSECPVSKVLHRKGLLAYSIQCIPPGGIEA